MSFRILFVVCLSLLTLVAGCGGVGETESGDPPTVVSPVNGYSAEPARISVDESVEDWETLSAEYQDARDSSAEVDLRGLHAAHTSEYLFLRVELDEPMNLQEGNDLTLLIDTDDDPATGTETMGVGAEISWTFGKRSGEVTNGGQTHAIGHADIGLTSLPTVRSATFEVALDRSAEPLGSISLSQSDSVRIGLTSTGDRLPDEDGGFGYVLSDTDITTSPTAIDRPGSDAIRLVSYNVRRDALFDAEVQSHYRRILKAVRPDVVGFQEVYEHTAEETGQLVSDLFDRASDWSWVKAGSDLVVGSRYPIRKTHVIPGYDDYESLAALLDADAALGSDLLVINMHPPCCNYGPEDGEPSSNAQRQQVVDGVAAFLRDVQEGNGPFDVPAETPITIVGDMNFVGDAQQPRTLRTGEIVNVDRFGSSAAPDWDGSSLLDTNPRQTARPLHTTWINVESSFPPGRLDYSFVSDSVLDVVHEYVLHTASLPDATLSRHGLHAYDTERASDHLPLVIDVSPQ